jgi:hypothetical protein
MLSSGVLLLLACVPASSAALLPRIRPLPRRLEAIVLDADGSFLDPDHKVSLLGCPLPAGSGRRIRRDPRVAHVPHSS